MPVSSITEHWIKQGAVNIELNFFGDPDYLQVSTLAGAVIMAFKTDVIGYNAAHNYRSWPLEAAQTHFEDTDAFNVYARLTRDEINPRALIIYDPILRDIEGREINYDDAGNEVLGVADPEYFYIYLGQISASVDNSGNKVLREWVDGLNFGVLDTTEQNNLSGLLLDKMFRAHFDDERDPNKLTSVEVLAGLWTDYFLSAKGMNPDAGSGGGGGGATKLGGLMNVTADADKTYEVAKMLVLEAKSNLWTLKNLSELVGLDENALATYLTNNNYAKKSDIPSLSGYATEQWVLNKGYLTEHQDLSDYAKKTDIPTIPTTDINKGVTAYGWGDHSKVGYLTGITSKLVTDALGYTPYDADDFTKANIKLKLGISDWALAASKPSYTTKEVSEDTNLYFTNARAVAALKSITDGLSGDISTLEGYFTDGVANSAKKLATARTIWGKSFDGTGNVSGDLSGVGSISRSYGNAVDTDAYGNLQFKSTSATDNWSVKSNSGSHLLHVRNGGNVGIGTTNPQYKLDVNGTTRTTKLVIGNGSIEWDETNKGFKIVGGLYTESYLSAKGANTNGGSSSDGGLIESLWKIGDLGKTFNTDANDTFNAYAINAIHNRVSVLEGKATNVSFTQSLTSGTQIGVITIDGASKNIYAPTIPTSDINKGVTAYGWGNHANVGYALASALSDYQPLITKSNKLAYSLISGVPSLTIAGNTISLGGTLATATLQSSLGLGSFAYKSSLAFADLASKPTTIGGYGITDALTALTSSANTNLYITVGGTTKTITGLYAKYTNFFADKWAYNSGETFDLNEWSSGGIVHCYGNSDNILNKPNGFVYGNILALSNGYAALTGQLAWAVNHNSTTDTTKAMWFRVNDSANGYTYAKWHQIAFVDEVDKKLSGYLPLSGGAISSATFGALSIKRLSTSGHSALSFSNNTELLGYLGVGGSASSSYAYKPLFFDKNSSAYIILHSGNYTDYTYSQSTIDTKLGGYLPLSGGTIKSSSGGVLAIDRTGGGESYIKLLSDGAYKGAVSAGSTYGASIYNAACAKYMGIKDDGTPHYHGNTLIHSGNIGSQSVANASNINNTSPILVSANESDEIKGIVYPSVNTTTGLNNNYAAIHNGLDFRWYNSHWLIANNRSNGAPSNGFGFWFSDSGNTYTMKAMISNDGIIYSSGGFSGELYGNAVSATKLQTARTIWGQSFDGTGNVSGNIYGGQRNFTIYGYNSTSASNINILTHDNNNSLWLGYGMNADGNSTIIAGTSIEFRFGTSRGFAAFINPSGNVGIGTTNPSYKLDVNGTLHASGAVSFDSILAVGGATRIDGNVAIGNGSDGNKLYVYGVVRSAAYNAIGNNNAAFVFDKRGSNYTGIGANGVADTIYFGACNTSGAWLTDYYQKWHFNGEVYAKTGVWSDGYVSAKGQNTSSDMRLKNILNTVVLGVKDIANAPSIRFAWKNGGGIDVGSSAQYWQNVLPDAVKERDGKLEMQYANIALLSAIALAKRSESHEERIKKLEKENMELKQRIVILEGGIYA